LKRLLPLLAVVLLLAPACARKGPSASRRASVVAMIGDEPMEEAEFEKYVRAATGSPLAQVSPQVASSLLDQFLEEELLQKVVDEADPKPAGQTAAERRQEVLARVARLDEITDDELRAEYARQPERWKNPSLVKLSQMILPTRQEAEAARRKVLSGTSWETVSREASRAPNAASGGGLGWLSREDLPSEFEKAVWGLAPGGVSPVLPVGHGVHLFLVEERADGRVVPFEEARPALRLALAERRSTEAVASLLDEARRKWPVAVIEEHLPFPYVGGTARFSLDSRP
jgi:parvulin-like peptidyl-prolyl isomerase